MSEEIKEALVGVDTGEVKDEVVTTTLITRDSETVITGTIHPEPEVIPEPAAEEPNQVGSSLTPEEQKKVKRYLARREAMLARRNRPKGTIASLELRKKVRRAKNKVAKMSRRHNKGS